MGIDATCLLSGYDGNMERSGLYGSRRGLAGVIELARSLPSSILEYPGLAINR